MARHPSTTRAQVTVVAAVIVVIAVAASLPVPAAAGLSSYVRAEHTLDFIGQLTDPLDNWQLGGSAIAVGDGNDKAVALTNDEQSQAGWMFSKSPAKLVGTEWQMDVQFRIHGKGHSLFGDGFAMWYTKEKFSRGSAFGHNAVFTGLGIFVDTYDNAAGKHMHKHPWISAMIGDGTKEYHHDIHMTGTAHLGCHSRVRQYGMDRKVGTLRVTYKRGTLTVKIVYGRGHDYATKYDYEWAECIRISDVSLPPGYYLGFTASTGDLTDSHEILSVRVRGQQGATEEQVPTAVRDSWALPAPPDEEGDASFDHEHDEPEEEIQAAAAEMAADEALGAAVMAQEQAVADAAKAASATPASQVAANPPAAEPATPPPPPEPISALDSIRQTSRRLQAAEDSDPPEVKAPTEEEIAELGRLVTKFGVMSDLSSSLADNQEEVAKLQQFLEERVAKVTNDLDSVLDSLKETEKNLEVRLSALEARVNMNVDSIVTEHKANSGGWVLPFVGLAVMLVAGGAFAYSKYRKLQKTHLL